MEKSRNSSELKELIRQYIKTSEEALNEAKEFVVMVNKLWPKFINEK